MSVGDNLRVRLSGPPSTGRRCAERIVCDITTLSKVTRFGFEEKKTLSPRHDRPEFSGGTRAFVFQNRSGQVITPVTHYRVQGDYRTAYRIPGFIGHSFYTPVFYFFIYDFLCRAV